MTQFHFISGLPRSGSTLLSAILRQNPAIHASMSSPVGGLFSAMQKASSGSNEAAMFLSDQSRARLLRSIFDACYAPSDRIVFDTNRVWPSKLPTLATLFPQAKFICCVRRPAWIVDSIERLIRSNPLQLSGIFGFEPGGTVFSRVNALMASGGLVGYAIDALREGYYSPLAAGRMWLVEYEALARTPHKTIGAIYDWLGIPRFEHDFGNIEQIPGAAAFDAKLGTPGLHSVRGRVEWRERESVLPPELFASLPRAFWRASPNITKLPNGEDAVPVLRINDDPPVEPAKTPDQVAAMFAEAEKMLSLYREKEQADE